MKGLYALSERQAREAIAAVRDAISYAQRQAAKGLRPDQRHINESALRAMHEALRDFAQRFDIAIRDGQRDAGRRAVDDIRRSLARLGYDVALTPKPTADLIQGLAHMRTNVIRGLSDEARGRVRRSLFRAALTGEPTHKIEEAIGRELTDAQRQMLRDVEGDSTKARKVEVLEEEMAANESALSARAEAIVRTETLRAYSVAWQLEAQEAAAAIPGLRKRWVAVLDDRVRPEHEAAHHSPPIPVNERFNVGGVLLLVPRDPSTVTGTDLKLYLAMTINCRCASELVAPNLV